MDEDDAHTNSKEALAAEGEDGTDVTSSERPGETEAQGAPAREEEATVPQDVSRKKRRHRGVSGTKNEDGGGVREGGDGEGQKAVVLRKKRRKGRRPGTARSARVATGIPEEILNDPLLNEAISAVQCAERRVLVVNC